MCPPGTGNKDRLNGQNPGASETDRPQGTVSPDGENAIIALA